MSENWGADISGGAAATGGGAATGGWIGAIVGLGVFIFHRLMEVDPPPPPPARTVSLPRVDAGAPYPLLFGTCRVRAPVLAWNGTPINFLEIHQADTLSGLYPAPTPNSYLYFMDMFFVIGIPMDGGCAIGGPPVPPGTVATNPASGVYWGDTMMTSSFPTNSLVGNGGPEDVALGPCQLQIINSDGSSQEVGGAIEFLNGAGSGGTPPTSNQVLVTPSPLYDNTRAGQYMTTTTSFNVNVPCDLSGVLSPSDIPGYRGLACAFLYANTPGTGSNPAILHWLLGRSAKVPAVSFMIGTVGTLGWSPVAAIYDVLTSTNGKLGVPLSRINVASFQAAAETLDNEGNIYWRSVESVTSVASLIQEMLVQADGGLYEDPVTGLITVWLNRNNYDPINLPEVNVSNCNELRNFALSGWSDIPNKIRLQFTNSDDDFHSGFAIAQNDTNTLVQSDVRQIVIQMPGVPKQDLANFLAARELAARSRPLIRCSAVVDRTFYRTRPGDVVKLSWPEYGLQNAVMRVAGVSLGTLADGRITLELLQDYFNVWRLQPPATTSVPIPMPPRRAP